jgi:Ca2+-binding EF-hand superfamily protein
MYYIYFRNFFKDCPDGKLTLKQFEHEYSKIMGKPTQKTNDYVKHMFNVYDQDKNQFIDFKYEKKRKCFYWIYKKM